MDEQTKHAWFPERPQGHGFATERQAIKAARVELGGKAKPGLAFITLTDNGIWGWLGASGDEYVKASLATDPIPS